MRFAFLITSVVLVLLLVSGCCDDDCPVCPEPDVVQPYKGWLYYVNKAEGTWDLYKVDTETDSLVDSLVTQDELYPGLLRTSQDGRYLALTYYDLMATYGLTRIYDAQKMTLLHDIPLRLRPVFDADAGLLVSVSAGVLTLVDIPSFTTVHEEEVPISIEFAVDRTNRLLYGGGIDADYWRVYVYNYEERRLSDTIYVVVSEGDTVSLNRACLNQAGTLMYFRGSAHAGTVLGCYDLVDEKIIFTQVMGSCGARLQLSPDEKELWATDPGVYFYDWNSGTIYIFDALSGEYQGGISLCGYGHPYEALHATEIAFTPTGEKAYVASGVYGKTFGAVLVVDRQKRQIVRTVPGELTGLITQLAICPRLFDFTAAKCPFYRESASQDAPQD